MGNGSFLQPDLPQLCLLGRLSAALPADSVSPHCHTTGALPWRLAPAPALAPLSSLVPFQPQLEHRVKKSFREPSDSPLFCPNLTTGLPLTGQLHCVGISFSSEENIPFLINSQYPQTFLRVCLHIAGIEDVSQIKRLFPSETQEDKIPSIKNCIHIPTHPSSSFYILFNFFLIVDYEHFLACT